eukprot:gnl/MRDRNA2_/MRDRNA2_103357_c0_seq1.p1 gnl/MRDRNA2_/MRDRNA2_103357_c0~~gnl/MRDRNA2_/MRDRNA2_103357_c0_seq1.p1  ORF type:complete len:220 (+),score=55.64 gnl/MRDRNA2_/MRDRNA2_103357_c0_seq1:77-736(+)
MAMCVAIDTTSIMGCSGNARMRPPSIDVMASNNISGPAICFQIGTPTGDTSDCHFIGTPTRESFKLKDNEADECFDCDDSDDDCSRVSEKSDCESEAETEASPSNIPEGMPSKFQLVEVTKKTTRARLVNPWVAKPQEKNRKEETFCNLGGGSSNEDDGDSDNDSDDGSLKLAQAMVARARKYSNSADDIDDDLLGGDTCKCDDDCEAISIGSFSDIEL